MRRSMILAWLLLAPSCASKVDSTQPSWQPHTSTDGDKGAALGNPSGGFRSDSDGTNTNSTTTTTVSDPGPVNGAVNSSTTNPGTMPTAAQPTKLVPPAASDCAATDESPLQTQADALMAGGPGLTTKLQRAGERSGGLDKSQLQLPHDTLSLGRLMLPIRSFGGGGALAAGDSDGDCLTDAEEAILGTDPHNPDTDGDGWFDGPCNERRKLTVQSVITHTSQDYSIFGGDDFYLIADDVRYPNNGIDDYWSGYKSGTSHTLERMVASRTRGTQAVSLALVTVEGWDDDWEPLNTWTVDDLLFSDPIDLGAYHDGETFTRRYAYSDSDYEVTYRVDIERFADPNPLSDGDTDNDNINESAEAKVAVDFGGITDPMRPDVLVEVDWMTGHRLRTESKRQVATRLYQHGLQLFAWRDEEVPLDNCLTVKDAQGYYNSYFTNRNYDAFRYSLISEKIWNNASGVTWGDMFLVNDATWWIDDSVMPQAGTFIHELGHTMSLTKQDTFHLIDSISWLSYDSAMNYTYQALLVDYSSDTPNDNLHHDDWTDVKPGYALQWSFALVNSDDKGSCQ